ncbi:NAD(P)H-binding protein [Pseudooctadecabacter sp.]|uniref:NAD(P)H-binding protein n=1 Tax=Pseudooctadecabacter sp. TaxID=1966338 RepID=UPI0035C80448
MINAPAKSVLLFGATGTIGRATAKALRDAGHSVCCVVREGAKTAGLPETATIWPAMSPTGAPQFDAADIAAFDVVVSCLASRTGAPKDAWRVDHDANAAILDRAQAAGIAHFVLLSAICVQKPKLAFQSAKLAFEEKLMASGLTYSIVRPTAFFKSLSGQVARVQAGKPFLLFGDGALTACKPISDADLGRYLTRCLDDRALHNKVLPIGGPGQAITPRQQGQLLFDLTGQPPKFRALPVWVMDGIIGILKLGGRLAPPLRAKAELAQIGRYYATESMLVWTGETYDADATPSFGSDTLADHYRAMIAGDVAADLGDHAVF